MGNSTPGLPVEKVILVPKVYPVSKDRKFVTSGLLGATGKFFPKRKGSMRFHLDSLGRGEGGTRSGYTKLRRNKRVPGKSGAGAETFLRSKNKKSGGRKKGKH